MSIPDAASWHDDQPLDGAQGTPVDHVDVDHSFTAGMWGDDATAAFADPSGGNLFSAEIENVSTSDWDGDTFHIWDDAPDADGGGHIDGLHFPL